MDEFILKPRESRKIECFQVSQFLMQSISTTPKAHRPAHRTPTHQTRQFHGE
jgi:hypothetical protein